MYKRSTLSIFGILILLNLFFILPLFLSGNQRCVLSMTLALVSGFELLAEKRTLLKRAMNTQDVSAALQIFSQRLRVIAVLENGKEEQLKEHQHKTENFKEEVHREAEIFT